MRTTVVLAPVAPLPRVAWLATVVTIIGVEALLVWRFGWSVVLVPYGYFGVIAVALGARDLATRKLPNAIMLPSYPIALTLLACASGFAHDWDAFVRAVAAMLVVGVGLLVLALATAGHAGFGDVKLGALVGLYAGWISWPTMFLAVVVAFLLAACWGLPMAVRKRDPRYRFAFGPFLFAGAFAAILIR